MNDLPLSRRAFVTGITASAAAAIACDAGESVFYDAGGGSARLTLPATTPSSPVAPGTYLLTPTNENDGALIVPEGADGSPLPLVIGLHGASQGANWSRASFESYAQARRFALLVPGARGLTWDVFSYRFSYDITFINSALAFTFSRVAIQSSRIALLGFSDGASYALALGLANGDQIPRVIACSPGFVPSSDSPDKGKPQFFLAHGRQDQVLNIDSASRSIAPALRRAGYDVTFEEFDGGHQISAATLGRAFDWCQLPIVR